MLPKDFDDEFQDILHRMYRQELRQWCQYFSSQLLFTKVELKQFITRNPRLLKYSITKLRDNVEFLKNDCYLDHATVKKMIRLQPSLLVHSIDNKLKPVVKFIRNDLQMEDRWKRIISRYPQVLSIPSSTLTAKVRISMI